MTSTDSAPRQSPREADDHLQSQPDAGAEQQPRPSRSRARSNDALPRSADRWTNASAAIAKAIPGRITFSTSLGLEDQAVTHAIATQETHDRYLHARYRPPLSRDARHALRDAKAATASRSASCSPTPTRSRALVAEDGIYGFRYSVEARKACCEIRKVRPSEPGARRRRRLDHGAAPRTVRRAARSVPFAAFDAEPESHQAEPDCRLDAGASSKTTSRPTTSRSIRCTPRASPPSAASPARAPFEPGEDIRAGRWWWENENGKECGLHSPNARRPRAAAGHSRTG